MFDQDLIAWSKIVAMMIFLPIYFGFLGYVFWRPNKAKIEAHAQIPFLDDDAPAAQTSTTSSSTRVGMGAVESDKRVAAQLPTC